MPLSSISPTDKIMFSLTAFADEFEREKARQRTYDAMLRKARAGHVTGGRVFGYENVEIRGRDGRRSHVERRINVDAFTSTPVSRTGSVGPPSASMG
jgi:DNA invertase Pin-like site-specific DNA recombinase